MDSKQVKDLMEAYASVYSSLNEEEMEDAENEGKEKEGKESGKDEGGKHKEGKHKKGKEEPGEKKTEKEDKEDVEKVDEAMSSYDRNRKRAAQRAADRNAARDRGQTGNVPGVGYVSPRRERETYTDESGQERHKSGARMPKKEDQKESFDLFDYLLEYLVAEGYADTNKAALAIMANMSEEWKQSIVEAPQPTRKPLPDIPSPFAYQPTPTPLPDIPSPFAKPPSRGDSGRLTTYGAGGGAAAERAGQSRDQIMRQGAKNIENKKSKPVNPVNQGPDFGR